MLMGIVLTRPGDSALNDLEQKIRALQDDLQKLNADIVTKTRELNSLMRQLEVSLIQKSQ